MTALAIQNSKLADIDDEVTEGVFGDDIDRARKFLQQVCSPLARRIIEECGTITFSPDVYGVAFEQVIADVNPDWVAVIEAILDPAEGDRQRRVSNAENLLTGVCVAIGERAYLLGLAVGQQAAGRDPERQRRPSARTRTGEADGAYRALKSRLRSTTSENSAHQ